MKYAFAPIAFGLGANALVARTNQQCYRLKASGGVSGVLGQLPDGQNRVGGGLPEGCYCLGSDGGFTDTNGNGCILTPPTTQFQCDKGASPTTGFAIGANGGVTYKGSGKFYACPVNDKGEYNIYSTPLENQPKCVEISLSTAGLCGPSKGENTCPASTVTKTEKMTETQKATVTETQHENVYVTKSMKVTVTETPQCPKPVTKTETQHENVYVTKTETQHENVYVTKTDTVTETKHEPVYVTKSMKVTVTETQQCPKPTPMKPGKPEMGHPGSCPANLNGEYQWPHLIIPVDSSAPHKAPGTSYFGEVNSHTCSIFNFDIPQSYHGKTCSVVFLFPMQKDLQTSSFTTSGSGDVSFDMLSGPASQQTSYENMPKSSKHLGSYHIMPGNSYTIATGECHAGMTVTYKMCSSGDYALKYFQDYNPSPIGLYVRAC